MLLLVDIGANFEFSIHIFHFINFITYMKREKEMYILIPHSQILLFLNHMQANK